MSNPKFIKIKTTIEAISNIINMENCEVFGIDGIPVKNKLTLNPEHMDLEFSANSHDLINAIIRENIPEITIRSNQTSYTIPEYNAHFEGHIQMDAKYAQHFDLRFNKLTQTNLEKEKDHFWRFIYPIDSREWFLKIGALPYKDDFGTGHFRNLIVCDLDCHQMNLFCNNVNGRHWLVIESTEPISYEEMDHRVLSLTIAMGFVLGKRYGDYCFHVASDDSDFSQISGVEALSLQETKYCPYRVLNNDNIVIEDWLSQYDYQKYALEDIKNKQTGNVRWYYNEESTVTMSAFGKLSQLCYKSNDMMLATSMLIDGSMMNIEYQKPFYIVVLETITSVLLKDDEASNPPVIPQEQYREHIEPRLLEALKEIPNLTEESIRIYTNRLKNNLNAGSNSNKLESCFSKYGYSLSKADEEAMNKRNSTFHGHLSSEKSPLRNQQKEMLAISLRLHKLCSILLLKEAGFEGRILNNEVLFGIEGACNRKEPVYICI